MRLWDYQIEGARTLIRERTWGLFDRAGAGKSSQALCAIPRNGAGIIGCPGNVKLLWREYAREWRSDLRPVVINGTMNFRWPREGELVIVNYEILPPGQAEVQRLRSRIVRVGSGTGREREEKVARLREAIERAEEVRRGLRAPLRGTKLIWDEAQRLKDDKGRATWRAREMSALVLQREGSVWLLTGTPLINRRKELWTVLQAAGLGTRAWGSKEAFDAAWDTPDGIPDGLRKISLCRTRPSSIVPIRTDLPVEITGVALQAANALQAALLAAGVHIETATLEQIRHAAASTQMAQVFNSARMALASAKIPALLERVAQIEQEDEPLVVFSSHRRPVDLLGARPGWVGKITGDESAAEKFRIATEFGERCKRGGFVGVAVQTRAGGVGTDKLQGASRALFVDLPLTAADMVQAEARLNRAGQQASSLLFERMVADHVVEKRVAVLIREKQDLDDRSVGATAVAV